MCVHACAWLMHRRRPGTKMTLLPFVLLKQGQLKSSVVCLSCRKESVTFDTFMYLSLPIPVLVRRVRVLASSLGHA